MNDDMLVRYLLNEVTEAERDKVAAWIAANDEHRRQYEQLRLIWDQSKDLARSSTIDEHAAWQRFTERAQKEVNTEGTTHKVRQWYMYSWVRVAAIFLIFCGLGWFFINEQHWGTNTIYSSNFPRTDTLPDGSVVILNKKSALTYPTAFKGDKRMVTLKGEGFFTITPNKSKPFIIDANGTSVTVVGTTFNVKTSLEKTEVIVETGIVQVAGKQKTVELRPNEKATVMKDKDPVAEHNTDELYNYYRTKEFICNATPLKKLIPVLNEAYNAYIVMGDDKIGDLQLTARFREEPLDNILKVISETLNLKTEYSGGSIILNNK